MMLLYKTGRKFILIGLLILANACEESTPQPEISETVKQSESISEARKANQDFTTYIIRAGQHSSYSSFKTVRTNVLAFEAVFDESAIYTSIDPVNQGDINKLYGLSDCGTGHQTNSARFGWRWYNNSLQIWAYVYHNGQRAAQYISTIELNKVYTYELKLEGSNYIFSLDGVTVTMPRGCSSRGSGYRLYPYFGGDEVAPHDITIRIRNL